MESTVSLFVASSKEIVLAGLVAIATDAAIRIVGTARTAEAALAGIEATAPAVALIGCALRDGDGFALARRIASRATGVRVVLFNPAGDGTHLAAATMQGEVQVWRVDRLRERLRGLGME